MMLLINPIKQHSSTIAGVWPTRPTLAPETYEGLVGLTGPFVF